MQTCYFHRDRNIFSHLRSEALEKDSNKSVEQFIY